METSTVFNNIGNIYAQTEKYDFQNIKGDSIDTGDSLFNLGFVCNKQGRF
jgi:hypothetical protein